MNDEFYEEVKVELRRMGTQSKLFKLVKAEMQKRGHWKNKPRGWHVSGTNPGPPKSR